MNSYQLFSGGGSRFLVFHLEADIPDEAIAWVEGILERYPGTPAIVSTHIYMSDETKSRTQEQYYRKDVGNSGEAVWNKLIKKNSQIFMVLCGHWANAGGEWYQVSGNDAGQPVLEILADYQTRENGGNGWLRLITSCPRRTRSNSARTLLRSVNTKPMRTVSSPCRSISPSGSSPHKWDFAPSL